MFEELLENIKTHHDELNRRIADSSLAMMKAREEKLAQLNRVSDQLKALHQEWRSYSENEKSFLELPFQKILRERYDEKNQIKLMKYMTRVRESAGAKMLEDENFANQFLNTEEFDAVIFSADIRRSTELMLKCKTPQLYAEFLNALTAELSACVKQRYGIYDKFTGDGLLAFFPDFYSGKDSILFAIQCACECQKIFDTLFDAYRDCFDIGDMKTGIGVGLDSGLVFKAGEDLEYTVVGKPVVYACRLSSAPAGHIYLTERAHEKINAKDMGMLRIAKTSIPIKHESDMDAFDVRPVSDVSLSHHYIAKPDWALTK